MHILMKCLDTILSRVRDDTWSSLDVIPKTTLIKLTLEGISMKPNALIIKAFDGFRRVVIKEEDIPIMIGLPTLSITFQVMGIHPAYNCLLGRP